MRIRSSIALGLGLGLGLSLSWAPSLAQAANGLRPRTPAKFASVPCMQTIAPGDVLHIDYSVDYDDIELTPDELPDSRKHQWFAFSKQLYDFGFPIWINQSDYDRAEQNGDITVMFGPEDILDTSAVWPAGTSVRITPDDPRLPITMEQAAMGIDWDTTGVGPGTWLVAAYTWEPENNLWSPRFGAVRIEDPADPEAGGPTVFLPFDDGLFVLRGEPLALSACVEAPGGSTFTASWATVDGVNEPQWVPFIEDEPVASGDLSVEFVPPAEAGTAVKVRIEVTDPAGRSYVAFTPRTIAVSGEIAEDDTGGGEDVGGGEGCGGCRTAPSSPGLLVGLGLLVLGSCRRRR
ncbi:hypothetical protein [Paraliomyxa miuraensis]|uniref:hypothetical protein n=1 Tax=Paraliomyxa miuraensis TaxID=376150 RepID=UPI002253EF11|nr:hypothetical protein [Paraliomyxa miuraensis]MCX4246404.1 hypothetical protein [Paraliomyxa miuraensis]